MPNRLLAKGLRLEARNCRDIFAVCVVDLLTLCWRWQICCARDRETLLAHGELRDQKGRSHVINMGELPTGVTCSLSVS